MSTDDDTVVSPEPLLTALAVGIAAVITLVSWLFDAYALAALAAVGVVALVVLLRRQVQQVRLGPTAEGRPAEAA